MLNETATLQQLEVRLSEIERQLPALPDPTDLEQVVWQGKVRRLKHAIDRFHRGGYGYCEFCHCPIPPERLRLFPEITTCVRCNDD